MRANEETRGTEEKNARLLSNQRMSKDRVQQRRFALRIKDVDRVKSPIELRRSLEEVRGSTDDQRPSNQMRSSHRRESKSNELFVSTVEDLCTDIVQIDLFSSWLR